MNERSQEAVETVDTREASNPVLLLALLAALAVVALQLRSVVEGDEGLAPSAPALATEPASCAYEATTAYQHAHGLVARAHARWERAAFDPRASMAALMDAEQAAACFRKAEDADAAARADAVALAYRVHAERDYRRLQLKLRVALERGQSATVLSAIGGLRPLMRDTHGPYARWLLRLEQELEPAGAGR